MIATPSPDRQPRRIQMSRKHPWRVDNPNAVIVSRPSVWGNPWTVGTPVFVEHRRPDGMCYVREFRITPAMAVAFYRQAFEPDADEIRAKLAGRDLACWCPLDEPCHADVLLEIANRPGEAS